MAIDRRDFLKFIVGGAVGTIFTPLPWVSMNEVAKWSQRWAPIPEKGGAAFLTSTCRLCSANCGIRVRVIEEKRAVKIDGNPFHPVNRGGLCPLGLAGLQYLYHEDLRVKTPLRRDGARGMGEWKPVTWKEAFYQITSRLKDLAQKDLHHTAALVDGEEPGTQALLAEGFLKAYGSPNYVRPFHPGQLEETLTQTLCGVRSGLGYDLPRVNCVLSFGCALVDGWGNPAWVSQAYQQWRQEDRRKRAKVIQIDTLATTTASLADEWVAIKPDSEGDLALGLARVIIEKGWYDKAFVDSHCSGLEALKAFLDKHYTPDRVAEVTGIPGERVERLARDFTAIKPSLALWGKGKGEVPVSLFEAQAVHLLNVLAGSIQKPGGIYLQAGFLGAAQGQARLEKKKEGTPSPGRLDEALSGRYPRTGHLACNFFENGARKIPYPINVLFLHEANPAYCLGGRHFLRAVEQIPFIVSFSSILDETNHVADLILPVPTFLERWDDSFHCPGVPFPIYGLNKPVLPPLYESKPFGEILLALAEELGDKVQAALPFKTMEDAIKETARKVLDSKKGRLADGPPPDKPNPESTTFDSFETFWKSLVVYGTWYDWENTTPACPGGHWDLRPTVFQSGSPHKERAQGDYPLWMIPYSLILLQSGYWPNPPFLTKYLGEETLIRDWSVVQVHPETARNLSLHEGDSVEIQSANGRITVRIHLFEGARPNCFFIPLGLGHQGLDPTLKDRGVNPYPLLDGAADPWTGLEVAWATRIKVKKL